MLLFRRDSNMVTIVDFLANHEDMAVLLKMTINHLRFFGENRISKVLVGISEKHHFENIFKSFGFRKSKNNLPVIIKLCGKNDIPNSLNPLLSGIENWHITYADKDTV